MLDQLKSCSPAFFEQLAVELLVAMGYGGSIEDAGKAIGKSGDGGIDGIINRDLVGDRIKPSEDAMMRPAVWQYAQLYKETGGNSGLPDYMGDGVAPF